MRSIVSRVGPMLACGMIVGSLAAGCGGARTASVRSTVSASATAAATALPSKQQQEKVLDAVYRRMLDHYSTFAKPEVANFGSGPRDVVDYGIDKLWRKGIDGAGTTVAVMEGWNDPRIDTFVAASDKRLGLPNPQITTIFPSGDHHLPRRCPPAMAKLGAYAGCISWGIEIELDVMSIHLMAPYAKIVIAITPADSEITDDAANQPAPPEMMQGVEAISRDHLANVISISTGTGEASYSHGHDEVTAQDPGELTAAAAGIPVVVASGDCGATVSAPVVNGQCETVPETSVWSDSPWTLAVGGTLTNLNTTTGRRLGPDRLWSGEGAGFSSIFHRPGYQSDVASVTRSPMRSLPDITMDAAEGTSIAAPLMAGVLSLATQANGGRDIGPVNTALYDRLGPRGAADGVVDVVRGRDPIVTDKGKVISPGFTAHKGFDVASGWGTIYAPRFVPALVQATRALHQERTVRAQAASTLAALRRAVRLSPSRVTGSQTVHLTATGFLPLHPVRLSIGGRPITTLHADRLGDIDDTIDPARLHLVAGPHAVTLTSMLITETGRLTTR